MNGIVLPARKVRGKNPIECKKIGPKLPNEQNVTFDWIRFAGTGDRAIRLSRRLQLTLIAAFAVSTADLFSGTIQTKQKRNRKLQDGTSDGDHIWKRYTMKIQQLLRTLVAETEQLHTSCQNITAVKDEAL